MDTESFLPLQILLVTLESKSSQNTINSLLKYYLEFILTFYEESLYRKGPNFSVVKLEVAN